MLRCQQGNVEYVLRVEGQHEIFTNFLCFDTIIPLTGMPLLRTVFVSVFSTTDRLFLLEEMRMDGLVLLFPFVMRPSVADPVSFLLYQNVILILLNCLQSNINTINIYTRKCVYVSIFPVVYYMKNKFLFHEFDAAVSCVCCYYQLSC